VKRVAVLISLLLTAGCAIERRGAVSAEELEASLVGEKGKWEEVAVQLPPPAQDEDLLEFFTPSGWQRHQLFIDARSLRVDADGVVRYTVVIRASGGARNVSYEGIRCQTGERRIYAHGRTSGQWTDAKASRWEKIRFGVPSEYQSALFLDYFCVDGMLVRDVATATRNLRDRVTRTRAMSGT
jgi:hypothetical protein